MPDVEQTVTIDIRSLASRGAIGRQLNVIEIVRTGVKGVGVRVTRQERKPMRRQLGKGHLQTVVIGLVLVRKAVDLSNVRELAEIRALRLPWSHGRRHIAGITSKRG